MEQMESKIKTRQKYSASNLNISKNNTLIILDWDDTIYPTSWTIENKIDQNNYYARLKYSAYFETLDIQISKTLRKLLKYGEVVIITNAMLDWIEISTSALPHTSRVLKKIRVISARQQFQGKASMVEWKKNAFNDVIALAGTGTKIAYNNIISIGDAEYEYSALVNLWKVIPHKYLKSIKFIKSPNNIEIIEQLDIIRDNIQNICNVQRHLDLKFIGAEN